MIERGRRLVGVAMAVLVSAAAAAAGPLQDDLAARRARLMERLGPNALAIVWSVGEMWGYVFGEGDALAEIE